MTQSQLDQLVAQATGEDLCQVRYLGFSLADPTEVAFDPEPERSPFVVDWDQLEAERDQRWLPATV